MVVKSGNWYWYSSVRAEHTHAYTLGVRRCVVVVASVVGCDAGVGLGLPNTEPTISLRLAYMRISRTHHLAEI